MTARRHRSRRAPAIGVLGGSFNPAHDGHRAISLYALKRLRLDEVWWLVSPQNPLKSKKGMAPFADRVRRARRAARHPRIRVSEFEARAGSRFTADSLRLLTRAHPRARFVWLMGADNLKTIHRWESWEIIFRTIAIAALARPPHSVDALLGEAARRFSRYRVPETRADGLAGMRPPAWTFLRTPPHPISATRLRGAAAPRKEGA